MSNIIQVKRGHGVPPNGTLAPYELGYDVDNQMLYIGSINNDNTLKVDELKVSFSSLADKANGFTEDAEAAFKSIKVDNATSAEYATEAQSAEQARQAQYAESAGSAKTADTAKEATYAYDADTAVYAETADQATNATNADKFKINNQYVNYNTLKSTLLKEIYPIGSIYMSVNSTSPANLFGGTWERLQDRFLVGASNTFSAGTEGGSRSITLTKDNLPSHDHGTWARANATDSTAGYNSMVDSYGTGESVKGWAASLSQTTKKEMRTTTEGNGTSFDILPPYLAVYMWKRTA